MPSQRLAVYRLLARFYGREFADESEAAEFADGHFYVSGWRAVPRGRTAMFVLRHRSPLVYAGVDRLLRHLDVVIRARLAAARLEPGLLLELAVGAAAVYEIAQHTTPACRLSAFTCFEASQPLPTPRDPGARAVCVGLREVSPRIGQGHALLLHACRAAARRALAK